MAKGNQSTCFGNFVLLRKMRPSLWLGIFVLVCCTLFIAESKSLGFTDASKQRKIIRFKREIFGFQISDIIASLIKAFVDSILDAIPVIG
ncbi:hypothetical protein AVEN_222058-1 [Araneus ventricosus]|uniref:Uncharacterized protein n=1 Tax=Araneus ventricosus TaxID=182803 RepID=A0A4Y2N7Y7_ARAVE|nr:hypothetical protein AVEN_222058-1 [Araneus ventricosus]